MEARAPDAAEEAHEPQSAIISSENKRKSRKDKKYQTEEEKRAGKNANNKNYRLKKKQAIAALKNSTEFEPFQLTGDVSFCAPSPEHTQFFVEASTNNSVIASRPWGEQSFEVLVEGVIYELQQVGKVVCLGRVLNNSPDPTKATKKFVQPGFARLPKPITQGTLNYVVFEWFPCVTPEPEKHLIPGEILMEYLSDQCKLTLTRTEKTLLKNPICICKLHSFGIASCRASLSPASMVRQEPKSDQSVF